RHGPSARGRSAGQRAQRGHLDQASARRRRVAGQTMTGRPAPDLAAESAVTLPWGAWRLEEARTFEMPPSCRVVPLPMRDRRAMTPAEVAAALDAPIGAPPLEVLAGEARSISIAVDDITRPTPAAPILSALLERLAKAGVPDERITLVMAS